MNTANSHFEFSGKAQMLLILFNPIQIYHGSVTMNKHAEYEYLEIKGTYCNLFAIYVIIYVSVKNPSALYST